MDNLTHSLCGWALARAGLNRGGKWVTPLVIALANLPDLEPVLLPGSSKGAYLLYHRGITHSVLMLTIYSVMFGALLLFLERRSQLAYVKAVGICAAGLFSHLLLDSLNNYGVRPWLPFASTYFYGDMLFIIEPWVWLMFGLPIFLGSSLNRRSAAVWFVAGVLTSALVYYGITIDLLPWPVLVVWLAAIGGAVLIRLRRQADAERCARTGLLVLGLYLALIFCASRMALQRGKADLEAAHPGETRELVKTSVTPHPAVPWRYDVLLQTNDALSLVNIDFFRGDKVVPDSVKLNLDDPALAKIRGTFEYRAWKSFARHPYVLRSGNVLFIGDLRFKRRGNDFSLQAVEIPTDSTLSK